MDQFMLLLFVGMKDVKHINREHKRRELSLACANYYFMICIANGVIISVLSYYSISCKTPNASRTYFLISAKPIIVSN